MIFKVCPPCKVQKHVNIFYACLSVFISAFLIQRIYLGCIEKEAVLFKSSDSFITGVGRHIIKEAGEVEKCKTERNVSLPRKLEFSLLLSPPML